MTATRADPDRPPCGPPPGQRRPWEWTSCEPVTDHEKRLDALSLEFEAKLGAARRERRRSR